MDDAERLHDYGGWLMESGPGWDESVIGNAGMLRRKGEGKRDAWNGVVTRD